MDDTDTSFLDIPGPSTRRWNRRPQPVQAASAPATEGKGGVRRKTSRLFRGDGGEALTGAPGLARSTASAPDVQRDDGSVDSRASSAVMVDPGPAASLPLGARMSNWWTSLLVVPDAGGRSRRRDEGREDKRATQTFLAAARQKAVGGVRYLLDGEAVPDGTDEVWVRGVVHRFGAFADTWPDSFLLDYRSTVWCTYRSQYAPIQALAAIPPSPEAYRQQLRTTATETAEPRSPWTWMTDRGLTTDAGWGCMLRTGQSLLANALVHHHLGRDWRLPEQIDDDARRRQYATYIQILEWFMDDPSPACPFSVHRMALVGKQLGKAVGEWFGPSTAAGAVKTLTNGFPLCGLSIVTATDSTIYASEVVAASHQDLGDWADLVDTLPVRAATATGANWGGNGVLILAGVRLGMQGVNPLYHDSIKALFTFPQSVGIAGGRPSSSYYFIGTQGDNLFYLDPHFTRPAVPLKTRSDPAADHVDWLLGAYTSDQLRTFHCEKVKKMPLSSLDPSMLMGFLCRDHQDWEDLRRRLNNLPQRIISIENTVPTWGDDSDEPDIESFTETDVDEESTGLSRQLSASTFAEVGEISASRDPGAAGAQPTGSSPVNVGVPITNPPTPTVSTISSPGIPFPRQETPGSASPEPFDVEDSFDSIGMPSSYMQRGPRHRSTSSGDRTVVKGQLEARAGVVRQ